MMSKQKNLYCCLALIIILFSCNRNSEDGIGYIVINEVLPVNSTIASDQDGQFDDWIELYNLSSSTINISGYYLSDSKSNPMKWKFPSGTAIQGNSYLIIWADKDTTQFGLHANFKLSSLGEGLVLSSGKGSVIDKVDYPAQTLELSYSRHPDGSGAFKWQTPTFNMTNGSSK